MLAIVLSGLDVPWKVFINEPNYFHSLHKDFHLKKKSANSSEQ